MSVKKVPENLNFVRPLFDTGCDSDWNLCCEEVHTPEISVYFKSLESHLVSLIDRYSVSVGCIAWLTNIDILRALGRQKSSNIIVQKEDFLRPDGSVEKQYLRELYGKITGSERFQHGRLGQLSYCGDPEIEGVRCVGNHNKDKNPACPRMHNKFLILGEYQVTKKIDFSEDLYSFIPSVVWTGSFNFTYNATLSFENAVVISNPKVVAAYYEYWQDITALSEPLNWEDDWVYPEWRVGS